MRCIGKCAYCDEGCQTVRSRMEKPTYTCVTTDPDPYIKNRRIPRKGNETIKVDEECKCMGKKDSKS